MTREIEIAREVQESLYPQERPRVLGLDYAGRCRPARGVGGDYFDFRRLEGGGLGVAVGDVSGKGVPAALLMASLQASIRSHELSGTDEEWGEDRLAATVRAAGAAAAGEILDRILAAADAFATGAEQHDDMTLVVLRVVA